MSPSQALTVLPEEPEPLPIGDGEGVKITGRIRVALEAMVYDGMKADEAAIVSGLQRNSLYAMLREPRYLAAYRDMLKVRRESTRARNLLRLEQIRDQDANMNAAVAATKVLEGLDAKSPAVTVNVNPGWVIDLTGSATPSATIDVTPTPNPNVRSDT